MTSVLLNANAPIAAKRLPRRHRTRAARPKLRSGKRPEGNRIPALRLTPYAWAKLLSLRDAGPTEVGGFGIASAVDPLLVEDLVLVRQTCTAVSVRFDDEAVADYFDRQIDAGLRPESFGRVWVHTHPGDSAEPSFVDEETFERCFGRTDWAVMFILAQGGRTSARLRFHCGPGGEVRLPVEVDWKAPFAAADPDAWGAEYRKCVAPEPLSFTGRSTQQRDDLERSIYEALFEGC